MQAIFGERGAKVMAAAILISTFGCVNGLVMAGARIYFAMARDGLFFKSVARANRFHVPGWALAAQGLWAVVLVLPVTATLKPGTTDEFEYGNLYNDSARIHHPGRCDVLHADGGGRHPAAIQGARCAAAVSDDSPTRCRRSSTSAWRSCSSSTSST